MQPEPRIPSGTAEHPAAFAKAAEQARALVTCLETCADATPAPCPLVPAARRDILPAIADHQPEPLWHATVRHAQAALHCNATCPAVDMLRALLDATRPAYRAAG